jgi:hypothetical protein
MGDHCCHFGGCDGPLLLTHEEFKAFKEDINRKILLAMYKVDDLDPTTKVMIRLLQHYVF